MQNRSLKHHSPALRNCQEVPTNFLRAQLKGKNMQDPFSNSEPHLTTKTLFC